MNIIKYVILKELIIKIIYHQRNTYLDRFCLLRFLQIANNMNTQQRIKNIMARRTAEMIPIFCVKETGGGMISFSTLSLIVSVLVYKIVRPSRSTWVAVHLQKIWFVSFILCRKKFNEYLIHLTSMNLNIQKTIICLNNSVNDKNLLEIFSVVFELGFVFACMFSFRGVTCLIGSVRRVCRIIKIGIRREVPI